MGTNETTWNDIGGAALFVFSGYYAGSIFQAAGDFSGPIGKIAFTSLDFTTTTLTSYGAVKSASGISGIGERDYVQLAAALIGGFGGPVASLASSYIAGEIYGFFEYFDWDGVYDPVESAIREVQEANPHIPPEEVAAIVTAQVAAWQQQSPWTMLEVDPWDAIDLEQIDSLERAYVMADSWTRHDPGGSGGGGGGNGGGGNTGSGSVSDGAGGSLPDTDGNGQADSDFDNTTGTGTFGAGGDPFVDSVESGNMGDTGGSGGWDGGLDLDAGIQPVILDLDGDGVEIAVNAQVNFDWDGDGFRESGNWAAADDGFLVVDLEAANLPAIPQRSAA